MKWIEAKVVYMGNEPRLAIELIADAFSEVGLDGVWINDPTEEPDEDWGEDAEPRPTWFGVTGYFPVNEGVDSRRLQLEAALAKLADRDGIKAAIEYRSVDEEDWAEAWKAYFWPVKITDRVVVKPTWREYTLENDEDIIIEIDPGMAFGTGTHATTFMCIQLIEQWIKPGAAILDIGTGSGILLVAAAKLGAGWGLGIDNDDTAVTIAETNLALNGIPAERFKVRKGNLTTDIATQFDLISANILTHVVLLLLDSVGDVLRPGGIFICSGISEDRGATVVEKMRAKRFDIIMQRNLDQWTAIAGKLRLR